MIRTKIETYDGLAAFSSSSHSSTSLHDGLAAGSCTVVAETEVEVVVLGEVDIGQGAWPRLGPQSGSPATIVGSEIEFEAIALIAVDDDGEDAEQGAWPRLGPQSGSRATIVGSEIELEAIALIAVDDGEDAVVGLPL
jgi:hypothetical protein